MDFTTGTIVEGTVKSITKFGAFVSLPGGRTGMVHISEIAHAYVSDIHEHLSEGQTVQVMVIAAEPGGKIDLSIKRTIQPPERPAERRGRPQGGGRPRGIPSARRSPRRRRGRRPLTIWSNSSCRTPTAKSHP